MDTSSSLMEVENIKRSHNMFYIIKSERPSGKIEYVIFKEQSDPVSVFWLSWFDEDDKDWRIVHGIETIERYLEENPNLHGSFKETLVANRETFEEALVFVENKRNGGLKIKYIISKPDGRPVDSEGIYFILKLNSKDVAHREASIAAALTYAKTIEESNPELAEDLRKQCRDTLLLSS